MFTEMEMDNSRDTETGIHEAKLKKKTANINHNGIERDRGLKDRKTKLCFYYTR